MADVHVRSAPAGHRVPRRDRPPHPRERALLRGVPRQLHERRRDHLRRLRRHRGPRRAVQRLGRRHGRLPARLVAVQGRRSRVPPARPRCPGRPARARRARARPACPQSHEERDETMQDPRCILQILRRHFSRYTPEMVEEACGIPQDLFRGRRGAVRQLGPRVHVGVRATRSAGRSTRRACSTSGRPRSSSCCSGTSAGPAAGSWRSGATPRSRARPTSRRFRPLARLPRDAEGPTDSTLQRYLRTTSPDPAGGPSSRSTSCRC